MKKFLLITPTALLLIIFSVCVITSCNNDKKNGDATVKPEPAQVNNNQPPASPPAIGSFTILKLEKQRLLELFPNGGDSKKLLIQFSDDGSINFMQAVAFAANKSNVYQNVMKTLIPASTDSWDTTGLKILGNNELTKKQIKDLIGGNINAANVKDLYFYPIKNSINQIYFVVSTSFVPFTTSGEIKILGYPADGQDTKPSPPAPPCATCE